MAIKRSLTVGVKVDSKGVQTGLKQSESSFKSFFKTVGQLGLGFTAGELIADGIRGIGRAVIGTVGDLVEFDQRLQQVSKTTGISGDELGALGERLRDLSTEIPVTVDGLADIAAIAGQLGITGSDSITKFTESIAKISTALDISAENAADSFAKIANAAGLNLSETPEIVNNIASAFNELSNTGAATAADIINAVQRVGNAGRPLGVTVDQLGALSASIIEAGIDAETAGTSLRNTFIFATQRAEEFGKILGISTQEAQERLSTDAVGAIQDFIAELGNAENAAVAASIGAEIFGTRSGQAIQALANNTERLSERLETSKRAFDEAISVEQEFGVQSAGLANQLIRLNSTFQALLQDILTPLIPVLRDVIGGVQSFLTTIREEDGFQKIIDNIGFIDNALRQLIIGFLLFKSASIYAGLVTGFKTIAFQAKMFGAQSKIALTNLRAGLFTTTQQFKVFRAGGMGAFKSLTLAIKQTTIATKLLSISTKILKAGLTLGLTIAIDLLIERFFTLNEEFNSTADTLKAMGIEIAQFAVAIVGGVADLVSTGFSALREFIADIVDLGSKVPGFGDKFANVAEAIRKVKTPAEQVAGVIDGLAQTGFNALQREFDSIPRKVEQVQSEVTSATDVAETERKVMQLENQALIAQNLINTQEKALLKSLGLQEDQQTKELAMFAKMKAKELGLTVEALNVEEQQRLKSEVEIQNKLFDLKLAAAKRESDAQFQLAKKTQELIAGVVRQNPIDFFGEGGGLDQISAIGGGGLGAAGALGNVLGTVGQGEKGAEDLVKAGVTAGLDAALPGLGQALSPVVDLLALPQEELQEQIRAFAKALPEVVSRLISNIPVLIRELTAAVPDIVKGFIEQLPDAVMTLIAFLIGELPQITLRLQELFLEILPTLSNKLVEIAPRFVQVLADNAPLMVEALITQFLNNSGILAIRVAAALAAQMPFIAKSLSVNLINQLPTIAQATAKALVDAVKDSVGGAFGGIGDLGGGIGGIVGSITGALGFAKGGVVPPGFPNDTFPAMLTSGERILSPAQTRAFDRGALQPGPNPNPPQIMRGQGQPNNMTQNITINITGADASDPDRMAQVIIEKLRTESARGKKIIDSRGIDG